MQILGVFPRFVWRVSCLWQGASLRRRLTLGVVGLILIVAGWSIYERYFSWPSRLILQSAPDNYPVAFSPDGSKLVTSSPRGFDLWDAREGTKLAEWVNSEGRRGTSGKFSPDGQSFVAFWTIQNQTTTPMIGFIDVASGQLRLSIPRPLPNVLSTAFMNEGRTIRIFSANATTRSFIDVDVATGKAAPPLTLSFPTTISWQVMSDDGHLLAIVDTRALTLPKGNRPVIFWDLDVDRQVGLISTSLPVLSINALALSHDGKTMAMSLSDQSMEIWDVPKAQLKNRFAIHSSDFRPWMLRISPDGSKVASYGNWASPAVSLNSAQFLIQRLAQNPNPRVYELVVHDVTSGRRLGRSDLEGMPSVFTHDGRVMATSSANGVVLRDLPPSP